MRKDGICFPGRREKTLGRILQVWCFCLYFSKIPFNSNYKDIGKPQLLDDIENNRAVYGPYAQECKNSNPGLEQQLHNDLQIANAPIPAGLSPAQAVLPQESAAAAVQRLDGIRKAGSSHCVPLVSVLPDAVSCGVLIERFLSIGVNPAGNDLQFQTFTWDNLQHNWTELFDLVNRTWASGLPVTTQAAKDMAILF